MPKDIPSILSTYKKRLEACFSTSLTHFCLVDVTDGHTIQGFLDGRAQKADSLELFVFVVSDKFEHVSRTKRHQMVTDLFKTEFESGDIHAMQIKAWTVKTWEMKGKPKNFKNKPCFT